MLAGTVSEVVGDGVSGRLGDEDVLATMAAASRIVRLGEALLIEMAAQVETRSAGLRDERMTTHYGCRSTKELVQRTTLQSSRTVGDVVRAARAVQQSVAPSSGTALPARYPGLA